MLMLIDKKQACANTSYQDVLTSLFWELLWCPSLYTVNVWDKIRICWCWNDCDLSSAAGSYRQARQEDGGLRQRQASLRLLTEGQEEGRGQDRQGNRRLVCECVCVTQADECTFEHVVLFILKFKGIVQSFDLRGYKLLFAWTIYSTLNQKTTV